MSTTLYFAPKSCSFCSITALEEAGADYETVSLSLASGDQRKSEFLKINPRGFVPALRVRDTVITENIAILTYVAQAYPAAGLLPLDDSLRLARAYELMSWFASGLHVTIAQIFRPNRFANDETTRTALTKDGVALLLSGYAELNRLMDGEWLLGGRFSVLDPYAFVFWRWGERLGLDMNSFGGWASHTKRLLERPSVIQALARESAPGA